MKPLTILVFIASIALSLYLLLVGYSTVVTGMQREFGFNVTFEGEQIPAWHAAATFAAIVFGVFCGIVIQGFLERSEARASLISLVLQNITPVSIIVAVAVFVFIFPTMYADQGDFASYLAAFQNGFLFRQVLSGLLAGNSA